MTNFKNEFSNDEVSEILMGKHDLATQKNVEKLLYLNDINQLPDSVYDSIVGSFEHNINCVGTNDWQKIIDYSLRKITHKTSNKIAKSILTLRHSVDPRTINIEDQIDVHLKNIGLGWMLKEGTYIDGVSIQSIKQLAQDIRSNAIERF